ncbi:MAG TPA: FKBP-type peptidyl-prolyl cis-trans isomerase [Cycloclasticus sp.]|jgi:peptidylprolyl isomerase|nr:FKBP-type peptidyl-prolyl cis-trans isomerase [Cycloclasticus sp.]HIL91221.1 FKBP-type peptidyl-prolyl cis-trans isomerase [Cycloclasticus sp.]
MKILLILIVIAAVFYMLQHFLNTKGKAGSADNIAAGEEFLAANASKDGVKTTSSGLQYLVLTQGTGIEHPSARDKVTVHYHGTLLNGTVFDSSVDRDEQITFGLNQVIKGWTEGLQLMVVGEKTRFFIPSNLAYGNQSVGSIQGGSTLIFDVELFAIKK